MIIKVFRLDEKQPVYVVSGIMVVNEYHDATTYTPKERGNKFVYNRGKRQFTNLVDSSFLIEAVSMIRVCEEA